MKHIIFTEYGMSLLIPSPSTRCFPDMMMRLKQPLLIRFYSRHRSLIVITMNQIMKVYCGTFAYRMERTYSIAATRRKFHYDQHGPSDEKRKKPIHFFTKRKMINRSLCFWAVLLYLLFYADLT